MKKKEIFSKARDTSLFVPLISTKSLRRKYIFIYVYWTTYKKMISMKELSCLLRQSESCVKNSLIKLDKMEFISKHRLLGRTKKGWLTNFLYVKPLVKLEDTEELEKFKKIIEIQFF